MSNPHPIPFEDALGELQQIVSALETGQVSLEQSLDQFERGVSLVSHCKSLLDEAHQRVEIVVSRQASGVVETAPFDVSATFNAEQATQSGADSAAPAAKAKRRRPEPDQKGLFS
jgi:exodeoxyribonuclease VII small subunit